MCFSGQNQSLWKCRSGYKCQRLSSSQLLGLKFISIARNLHKKKEIPLQSESPSKFPYSIIHLMDKQSHPLVFNGSYVYIYIWIYIDYPFEYPIKSMLRWIHSHNHDIVIWAVIHFPCIFSNFFQVKNPNKNSAQASNCLWRWSTGPVSSWRCASQASRGRSWWFGARKRMRKIMVEYGEWWLNMVFMDVNDS